MTAHPRISSLERTQRLQVVVSDAEAETIRRLAAARGVSVSAHLREAGLMQGGTADEREVAAMILASFERMNAVLDDLDATLAANRRRLAEAGLS